jgi:hypothetical protein
LWIVASVLLRHGVTEPVLGLVSVSINEVFSTGIGTLHHRQDFGEPLSVLGNTFVRLSEGEFLPSQVVCLLADQVDDALVARGTTDGSQRLSGEHGVILVILLTLVSSHHEVIQIFNVLFQVEDLLSHGVFISKAVTKIA